MAYSYGTVLLDLLSGKHIPPSHVLFHSVTHAISIVSFSFRILLYLHDVVLSW